MIANPARDGVRLLSFDAEIARGATVYGTIQWEGDTSIGARAQGHFDLFFYPNPISQARRALDARVPYRFSKWRISYFDGHGIYRTAYF
jgi:hypothetical protein